MSSVSSLYRSLAEAYQRAKIYSADQGATHGGLFITFNVGGDPYKARGYFKTVSGKVIDKFTITAQP